MIFPKLLVCLCVLMGSAFADDVDEMINVALHEKMEAVKAEMDKKFKRHHGNFESEESPTNDREAMIRKHKEEHLKRYGDRFGADEADQHLDSMRLHHRRSRDDANIDMQERHSNMLERRAERYRERLEKMSSSISQSQRSEIHDKIEEYISKEKDLLASRLNAKQDRMRPTGDIRDPEVKKKFKEDLRRSIDERKDRDRQMRHEVHELRKELDEKLNANPGADL